MKKLILTLVAFCASVAIATNSPKIDLASLVSGISSTDEFVVKDMRSFDVSTSWPVPARELILVGYFSGSLLLPATKYSSASTVISNGGRDGFVLQVLLEENSFNPYAIIQLKIIRVGGAGNDEVRDIDEIFTKTSLSNQAETVVTGYFENTCVVQNSGTTISTLNSMGGKDVFYASILCGANFSFYTAQAFGGGGDDEGNSITRYENKISILGSFNNTISVTGSVPYCAKNVFCSGGADVLLITMERPYYSGTNYTQISNNNVWIYAFGGALDDIGTSLMYVNNTSNISPNLMITGVFKSPVATFFLPGQTLQLTNALPGTSDIFIAELPFDYSAVTACNVYHNWCYLYRVGGNGDDISTKVFNQENYIILTGSFEGVVNFRLPGGTYNLTSTGMKDGFIATYRRLSQWTYNNGTSVFTPSSLQFIVHTSRFGGSGNDVVNGISTDYSDINKLNAVPSLVKYLSVFGDFENSAAMSRSVSGDLTYPLVSNGSIDAFFIHFVDPSQSSPLNRVFCYNSVGGNASDHCYSSAVPRRGSTMLGVSLASSIFVNGSNLSPVGVTDGLIIEERCCDPLALIGNYGGSGMEVTSSAVVGGGSDIYIAASVTGVSSIPLSGGGTFSYTSASGSNDLLYLKVNSSNTVDWSIGIGGVGDEIPYSVVENGNYIFIGGEFNNSIVVNGVTYTPCGGANDWDCFLLCANKSNGAIQWFRQYGGIGAELIKKMTIDNSGNIYITGTFLSPIFNFTNCSTNTILSSGSANTDVFLAKISSTGSFLWGEAVGIGGYDEQVSNIYYSQSSSSLFLTGYFYSTLSFGPNIGAAVLSSGSSTMLHSGFIARYNPSNGNNLNASKVDILGTTGTIQFDAIYEVGTDIVCIANATGQNFSFAGGLATLAGNSSSSTGHALMIARYNSTCNFISATQIGEGLGSFSDYAIAYGVCKDASGNIYVTGKSSGTFNFINNLTIGSFNGNEDWFALKLNSNSIPQCAGSAGSSSGDLGLSAVFRSASSDIVLAGFLAGPFNINGQGVALPGLMYQIGILNFSCCQ